MPDPRGFLRHPRRDPARRPVELRLLDWREVYPPATDSVKGEELIREQATRCMDCGIPFCHSAGAGCPLGNRIPDWNDLVRTGDWAAAIDALHSTNNFPEFTGKLCPAPCEAACVLGIGDDPVTIKHIEAAIAERAIDSGEVRPRPARYATGRSVGIVGSGPAGLAAAQQLARAGHRVIVYERDDAIGGLLRYGIPDFKLEKHHVDRRVEQLRGEGVRFVTGCAVGVDYDAARFRADHDAVLLACGALEGREAELPGRNLTGVYQAMEYLVGANRAVATGKDAPIDVAGKNVIIIGGGDTAADCLGVAHRQGAATVTQLDRYPEPPTTRDSERDPWPTWPWLLRTYPAHEEGGERAFAVTATEFLGDAGRLRSIGLTEVRVRREGERRIVEPVPGTGRELPADVVLLAIGFSGTEDGPLLRQLGVSRNAPGVLDSDAAWQTEAPGVFVAGDMRRGASLIVWAIAEGRSAAAAIHSYLGSRAPLPAPVTPGEPLLRAVASSPDPTAGARPMENVFCRLPVLAQLLILAVLGGSLATLTKAAVAGIPAVSLVCIRFLIMAAVIGCFSRSQGEWPSMKAAKRLVFLGGPWCAGVLLFTLGIKETTAGTAQLIHVSIPVLTAVLALSLYQEALRLLQWLGVLVAIAGVVVIILDRGSASFESKSFVGNIIVFVSALGFALFIALSQHAKVSNSTPFDVIFVSVALGAAITLPFATGEVLRTEWVFHASVESWVALIAFSLISSLYYVLFQFAIKNLGSSQAVLNLYLVPLFAVVWAFLLLGEVLGISALIGGVIAMAGVWLVTSAGKRTELQPADTMRRRRRDLSLSSRRGG